MTVQGEDEPSMSATENTLEDYLVDESALSPLSDVLQRPDCDHQTVVELRLVGGEQNIEFEDQNLLETASATDHQDETSASGMVVNNNNNNYYYYYYHYYYYYYYYCCYCYHYHVIVSITFVITLLVIAFH